MLRVRGVLIALLALAAVAPIAHAEPPKKPIRSREVHGSGAQITVFVPWTSLGLGRGMNEQFTGKLFFWQPSGPVYTALTDIALRDTEGRELAIPDKINFRLAKDGEPAGGKEDLDSVPLPAALRFRLVAESDFALVPLRMLFPHEMPSAKGGKPREKSASHEFWHIDVTERNLGGERVSMTELDKQFTRTCRTFRPSGFQMIDYVQAWEDARDKTVMASFGVRILAHPTRALDDGREAPSGVFHIAMIKAYQLDWMKETVVIDSTEWDSRFPVFQDRLADALFDGIELEAIGDPFDSPSALALRTLRVLTDASFFRLTSEASTKSLAAISPHLLDLPLGYDPAPLAAARARTEDPVARTLLAAACAAAGLSDPSLINDARLGLHSKNGRVQHAASLLARALADPSLVPDLGEAAASATEPEHRIRAILGLGTIGDQDAIARLKSLLSGANDERVKCAIVRALADAGEATTDSNARAGAISPQTGLFELMEKDPSAAADVLKLCARLSSASRAGDEKPVLEVISAGLEADPTRGKERAISAVTTEWRTRLGAIVPKLGKWLNDARLGTAARHIAHGSGRAVVPALLKELESSTGEAKKDVARLLGATKDPRGEARLRQLSQSDKADEQAAGREGLNWLRRDD